MPFVPIQPAQQISTDVPGVSTNPLQSMGQTGKALEALGGPVANESLNVLQQVQHAEAVSSSSDAYAQGVVDSNEAYQKIKTASKDGYVTNADGSYKFNPDGSRRGITEEYRDWANDQFQDAQESMPSGQAKDMLQAKALPYYTQEIVRMQNDQHQKVVDASAASDQGMVQKLSDVLVSAPDVANAYEYSNTVSSSIQQKAGSVYEASGPNGADKMILDANHQIAASTMRGAYSQILSDARSGSSQFNRTGDVDRWLSVLDGNDSTSKQRAQAGLPTIATMLKPDTKASIRDQLIQLKRTASALDVSAANTTLSDAAAALELGQVNRVSVPAMNGLISQMQASGKWKPAEAADKRADLVAAQGIGAINTPQFALASPDEQKAMISSAGQSIYGSAQAAGGGSVAGSKAQLSFQTKAAKALQDSLSQKQEDFPDYVMQNDTSVKSVMSQLNFSDPSSLNGKGPAIQQALQKIGVYYDRNFPGNDNYSRVLSDDQSDQLSGALKNTQLNPEQTANAIKTLRTEFGSYYPEMMNDMILDGKLPESWRVAGLYASDATTQNVAAAIKGGVANEKNFTTILEGNGATKDQFNKEAGKQLSKWTTTMLNEKPGDPANSSVVSDIQGLVKNRAMQIYEAQGGGSVSDAVDSSVKELLEKNFSTEDAGPGFFGSGKSYTYRIPNQTAQQKIGELEKDQIRQFVNENNSADALKKLGVKSPPGSDDNFYAAAAKTGYYALAQNNQGYNYFYTDPTSGRIVPARVADAKGGITPLVIPISTMIQPTAKAPQARKVFNPGGGP